MKNVYMVKYKSNYVIGWEVAQTLSSHDLYEERRCSHMEFLLALLIAVTLEVAKTLAKEGTTFAIKKLEAKKRKKKTSRQPRKRGKSSKRK